MLRVVSGSLLFLPNIYLSCTARIHLQRRMPLYVICLDSWVIFHCAVVSVANRPPIDGHLGRFQVFVIVHESTVGIPIRVS